MHNLTHEELLIALCRNFGVDFDRDTFFVWLTSFKKYDLKIVWHVIRHVFEEFLFLPSLTYFEEEFQETIQKKPTKIIKFPKADDDANLP